MSRDPSYPDRARIDSDVRAFLRPASSPWIVFDRDSRADFAKSALRVGAVFASAPVIVRESVAEAPMFPPSAPEPAPVEPSTLTMAADVAPPPPKKSIAFTIPPELVRSRRPALLAAVGVVAVLGLGAAVLLRAPAARRHAPAVAAKVEAPPAVAVAVEPPPAPAPVAAPEEAPPPPAKIEADPKTKLLGKFTIKADPKIKNVWFDGKRMLGSGQRTFLVKCGMHQVAVNEKSELRDVEVPCNGEYVTTK